MNLEIVDLRLTIYEPEDVTPRFAVALRILFLAVAVCCLAGCSKKIPPSEATPNPNKSVSVADETVSQAPPPPPPTGEAIEATALAPATSSFEAKIPPELAKIMVAAQKQALATGRFPTGWNDLIAAKIITEPPRGKDGKPMTWKEFERAIDPQ